MKYRTDDEKTAEINVEEPDDNSRQTITSRSAMFYEAADTGRTKERDQIRILVVEDNALNREIAKELLEDIGYLVETAEDGESAVLMIQRSDRDYYDAVLMDIQMPGIDGYEAARNIRRMFDWEHAQVPIIAMTANAFEEDMERARSAGMNAYIAKPVEPEAVREILEQVLANRTKK
jgi:CheY-like chemotaxis protein